jgi:dolichol-phosphate mannosyltransferase
VQSRTPTEIERAGTEPAASRRLPAPLPTELTLVETPPCVFVVPAFNEEENIVRLLDDFASRPRLFEGGGWVIVVDDGSQDGTVELARAYPAPFRLDVVELGRNQGPGAAFRAGFAAALERCSDDARIVTLEADTTSDLDALPEMLELIDEGADVVLADWRMENVSARRRMLSAGAGFVVRNALGLDATTVSSFFRVYRSETLRAAFEQYGDRFIQETGFACKAEILAKLTASHARVEEVAVTLDWDRRRGTSKMPVMRTMLAYWRMMFRVRATQESA